MHERKRGTLRSGSGKESDESRSRRSRSACPKRAVPAAKCRKKASRGKKGKKESSWRKTSRKKSDAALVSGAPARITEGSVVSQQVHGLLPDRATAALLILDMISDFRFRTAAPFLRRPTHRARIARLTNAAAARASPAFTSMTTPVDGNRTAPG